MPIRASVVRRNHKLEVALSSGGEVAATHAAALSFVRRLLGAPDAKPLKDGGGTLTFRLDGGTPLSAVFAAMGARPESAGIATFALRQSAPLLLHVSMPLHVLEATC